ncbi:hypothetical protein HOLleu_11493 [Holothuria leucospilota]|uniref:CUB domain-containing protein n=1 Tax=Holothuria leucospilota TaxID=206669 RepID=A0A9Q1HFL6_HOLLE|nr:hypothetical protein HOLleu_11493 [Holothuria leucospilota]
MCSQDQGTSSQRDKTMRFLILYLLARSAVAYVPLTKNKEPVPGRYIVKLKEDADPSSLLEIIYKVGALDSRVEVFQRYEKVFNGFTAALPKGLLSTIQEFDMVESIEEDGFIYVEGVSSWGLDRIDQKYLPLSDTFDPVGDGEGVTIYILDTGINDLHDEFEGRNVELHSVMGRNGSDCHGHGTHCAATAAGNTYGVARKANITSIQCMQCGGAGVISDIVAALEWVAANATTPAVVSMSIAGSASPDLDEAVEAVTNKSGILVVVAAGNGEANACTWSPPRVSVALSVGATDENDNTWSDSNRGGCVDLMAPGVDIVSAWKGGSDVSKTLSGTSMATPHVAGAAAVLLAQNPNQTAGELKANLQVKATAGAVNDCDEWTPNLLLYLGEGSGGGSVPPETALPTRKLPAFSICDSIISRNGSFVTSSTYPYNYYNYQDCEVSVNASSSDVAVMISFSDFNIEYGVDCAYDKLKIYDGDSSNGVQLANLCGDKVPGPVYSSSSKMTLVLQSDSSVTKKGFNGTVYFVDKNSVPGPCIEATDTTNGLVISSRNFPNNYNNNEMCNYLITADSNSLIKLTFTSMDIEDDQECLYDKLLVYDGSSSNDPLIATLCGNTIPPSMTSSSNEMLLEFTSDYSVTEPGFKATVTFIQQQEPTTKKPTTVKPTTEEPTTEKPTTEKPTTEKPTTEKPTTEKPTTEKPTTEKPTTEKPTTEEPTTEEPTTEEPTTQG